MKRLPNRSNQPFGRYKLIKTAGQMMVYRRRKDTPQRMFGRGGLMVRHGDRGGGCGIASCMDAQRLGTRIGGDARVDEAG